MSKWPFSRLLLRKNTKKWRIWISVTQILIITDKQNKYLLITKGIKIQDGRQFWPKCHTRYQINLYAILNNALNSPKGTVFDSYVCLHNKLVSQRAKLMGPTWGPPGPHVGPMNLAIRDVTVTIWGYMGSQKAFTKCRPRNWRKTKNRYFQTQLLLVINLQYIPLNICFWWWQI